MPVEQVSRQEWRAANPRTIITLDPPVTRVFCCFTSMELCAHSHSCEEACRYIQRRDMGKYFMDIQYSFLVGGDGRVYEGRGWEGQPKLPNHHMDKAHTSIFIGLIGNSSMNAFSKMFLVDIMQEFIRDSVKDGYINSDYQEIWATSL